MLSIFFQIMDVADKGLDVFRAGLVFLVCPGVQFGLGQSLHPLDDLILLDDG